MAGWDGSGNFVLNYQFVQDAANGIKILASRQDTQWTTVANGLMNCLTRDGQTAPTANISWNGFKLQNLGAPAVGTDAARLMDLPASTSEWAVESNPFAFVSTTQFKLTGIDLTARYDIARRLKIVHNGGATTSYGQVFASSFAVDTTVSVKLDAGAVLVSPLTAVSYAILDAANPSSPEFTAIFIYSTGTNNLSTGTAYTIGAGSPWPTTTSGIDTLNELGSGVVTVKRAGLYLVGAQASMNKNGATLNADAFISVTGGGNTVSAEFTNLSTQNVLSASISGLFSLAAGQQLTGGIQAPGFTGGPVQSFGASVYMIRVR